MIKMIKEGNFTPAYGDNGLRMVADNLNKAYYKCALPMYSAINISDNELDMILDSPDFPRYKNEITETLDLIRALAKDTARQLEVILKILNNGYTYKESKSTKKSGRKLKESNDFADEPIVMYYKGKKIFEGGSDELGVKAVLSDLMYGDDKFYQDAKDFLENELGIEVTDIDDCAYTLADQIDTEATYADSIESFYIPFGKFEAFFKSEEALT